MTTIAAVLVATGAVDSEQILRRSRERRSEGKTTIPYEEAEALS
jgi:hypothetical protein